MSKKVLFFLLFYLGVIIVSVGLLSYLHFFSQLEKIDLEQKKQFNIFVGLGGLAITSTPSLRHPFFHAPFELYSVDGALREYTKESLIFANIGAER